jgi:dephospho-CoA kinase
MIIGLTGSIASGKSTIAEMLERYGVPIVDGDVIAREVVEPGQPTLQQIVEAFGEDILTAEGTLDRPKLGSIIFSDIEKRKALNAIIHPAIRAEMVRQRDAYVEQGKSVVLDIPLLFENKLQHLVEKVLVVTVSEETQLTRLMERNNLSETEAKQRIASQLPLSVKEAGADAVIHNNGTIEESEHQLQQVLNSWNIV